mmetsp:Transcript_53717/g.160834  ORF Transcript_53717/g.160834 Transcript_53717/m.160834 type:complete len:188 (-) Transcript_53717:399-962(-)
MNTSVCLTVVALLATILDLPILSSAFVVRPSPPTFARAYVSSKVCMAGFGSASGGKKGKKAKKTTTPLKLKPKSQWDRYCDVLKKSAAISVGVRVVKGDERGDWLKVGRVKSVGDEFTELAVAMQRGLIAEVSTLSLRFDNYAMVLNTRSSSSRSLKIPNNPHLFLTPFVLHSTRSDFFLSRSFQKM